ncbi:MAG TPA: trigger factor [Acidobacteriaceae bacterium]|nr:trigger factor [Acidobacteriaceae bacterium]
MTPTESTEENLAPEASAPAAEEHTHEGHDHADHEHHHHPAPTLNPELTRTISVEAPVEEVDKAFRHTYKRYQKLARIPGFRVGKVPESLIKSRFAKEVRQEVLEALVDAKFRKALTEQNAQPVSQPQVSELFLVEGQPLRFKATFEAAPQFDIAGYDTVTVHRPDAALTEGEFEAELENVLDHHATIETIEEDRPLADGDWAEIGFTGKVQDLAQVVGEEGLESKTDDRPIKGDDVLLEIGGKQTLPAFTEGLRGAKVGQELTLEVVYPGDFGDTRLAGNTVSYDITVKAIKHKDFPERDDEFAKELGAYESWAEFETKLRERVGRRKSEALTSRAKEQMLDDMLAKFNFPLPESFVQQQIDARLERGLRALAQQGMTSDAMRKLDFGQLRDAQREQAMQEVKASILLDRLADAENVTVSDDDMNRELLMMSIQQREPLETLRSRLAEDGSLDHMREQMRRENTATHLFEKLAS